MTGITILIAGFAMAFNIIVIMMKYSYGRNSDATMDLVLLILLGWIFSGSQGGLMIGIVASAIISLYLFFNPPNMGFLDEEEGTTTTDDDNKYA